MAASRETNMGNKPSAPAAKKPCICYNCGKKLRTPEEIIENERAEYCETCYRDRFFYHTPNGGKNQEQI